MMMPNEKTTDEQIAALLDGRLDAKERQQLMGQLAASREWTEVLADATRVLEEEAAVGGGVRKASGRVMSLLPSHRTGVAIAAALVVIAGGIGWWQRQQITSDRIGRMVATTSTSTASLPTAWSDRPWSTTRGSGVVVTDRGRAIRIGAALADLRIASRTGDTIANPTVVRELELLLSDIPGSAAIQSILSTTVRQPSAQADQQAVQREFDGAVAKLVGEQSTYLGAQLEVLRIAVMQRDEQTLERESRKAAAALAMTSEGDAPLQRDIKQLDELLASPTTRDWDQLGAALDRVLIRLAR
ncbi:MAG: hypothetical protein ABI877_03945 [Gemmatimonadaceae bacterium]